MKTNPIGLTRADYTGGKSTLCAGCGHDSITNNIISAFFQSGVNPYHVAKMSGIGCSSKTPAYFLNKSHGFNSLHGRMAPVATGAKLANKNLVMIGVSGDGDSASIGLGGFSHMIRRDLPIVYIIENNGVYGLTKGQFSATADPGSTQKSGEVNPFSTIDLCTMAIDLGCRFVARSFSGDSKQLVPIIDAAIRHNGTAIIDVVSPCVTFANHDGSTKSYTAVREHSIHLQELGFIQPQQPIEVEQNGDLTKIELFDGSTLTLRNVKSFDHQVDDADNAIQLLRKARNKGEILTGLFYYQSQGNNLLQTLEVSDTPLKDLGESDLRPDQKALDSMMSEFK